MMCFPLPPSPPPFDPDADMAARWDEADAEYEAWRQRCARTQVQVGLVVLVGVLIAGPFFVMLAAALAR